MKPNKLAGVFLLCAVCIMALAPLASAQQKKPQLYFIEDYVIKPSMAAAYEATHKDLIATVFLPYNWSWPLADLRLGGFPLLFGLSDREPDRPR